MPVTLAAAGSRSIPSLDGLRAIAIVMVIVCHVQAALVHTLPMVYVERIGSLAVNMFFVLSGYLITHLLLTEQDRHHGINLPRFYLRRSFRIFPPFYVYLAAAAIVHHFRPGVFTWGSFASAATYVWNYNLHASGWLLGHTWSLSLEEQFYLFWPLLLLWCSRRACLAFSIAVIVLSPLLRVATYFLFSPLRGHIDIMLPTHLDTMMVGCFLALAAHLGRCQRLIAIAARPVWTALAAPLLLVVCPLLEKRYRGMFYLPVGITLTSVCCGAVLLYAMRQPASPFGRVLNLPWVRHIGVLSYSLYLWQQMFTGPEMRWFPFNLVAIFVCAELSYWLVERPSFRLRDYLTRRRRERRAALVMPYAMRRTG